MNFKIATWNVNSLRVRLPHLLMWLKQHQPDVIALQETKLMDTDFPLKEIREAGYFAAFSGQKTYNGVAVLSRKEMLEVASDIPMFPDPQRRMLGVSIDDIRVINLYIPNGQAVGSEKYQYKLKWLEKITAYLTEQIKRYPKLIVVGDFNIAPSDMDVHDPKQWEGKILVSEAERAAFQQLLSLGLVDCFREACPQEKSYSWWDYRLPLKRNLGLRIDHIIASNVVYSDFHCYIDKVPREWERPSDHAPVIAEIRLA